MADREKTKQLMQSVHTCLEACNHCFEACLREEEIDMLRKCIQLDRECADVCSMVLSYAGRPDALRPELVEWCKTVCEACGEECQHHEHMDHCQVCAEACFQCAEVCQNYTA